MRTAEELAGMMAASALGADAQIAQTRFRMALVDDWQIAPGARVLEIGCGQGDTTAVLAEAVGPDGHVLAVDLAEPSWGSPITLGDSAQALAEGPLGDRLEFRFGVDVLDDSNAFAADAFDVIVLAHCTWYFASLDVLRATLARVRAWAPRLCLSEWDLEPRSSDQLGHLLAVLIQGQIEAYRDESLANVRTPYAREALRSVLADTGFAVSSEALVDSSGLDDARWEIEICLLDALPAAPGLPLPPRLQTLVASQGEVLRRVSERRGSEPLPAYSIVALRV
jgi:SAM-dependent methyltransferase